MRLGLGPTVAVQTSLFTDGEIEALSLKVICPKDPSRTDLNMG